MPGASQLDAIISLMAQAHGRDLSCFDQAFLRKTLRHRLASSGSPNAEAYAQRLAVDPQEAEALWRALGITYSEFFRETLTFALLEQLVLPGLLQEMAELGRPELRLWSAAGAAGQEAYSLAILLEELTAGRGQEAAFRIFATDICPDSLAQGQEGLYEAQALQNVRLRHLNGWFTRQGEAYRVVPRLRERVAFSVHDLLDQRLASPAASIYGDFDLVMCSNLLFYYRADIRGLILDRVGRSLRAGGYLVTGQAERAMVEQDQGLRALAPVTAVFRKADQQG
ncbi:MAG: hypothetical protein HY910_02595 [Desulfarculus sp.]|nr:hypothetical protein [Desulfarculus sp.]